MVNPPADQPLRPLRVVAASTTLPYSAPIVWDAIIDADLACGWLGRVVIDPVLDGRYAVEWPDMPPHAANWSGRIEYIETHSRLLVRFEPHTWLDVALSEIAAGPRGLSTRLELQHGSFLSTQEAGSLTGFWTRRLELLGELLRGHPARWQALPHD